MKLELLRSNKTLIKFISSSFLSLPVSLVTGFITFRSIDPYFMGIWTALSVFETYASFMRLGIVNGMNRELPHALGSGQTEKAYKYAETTLAYTAADILILLIATPFLLWKYGINQYYMLAIGVAAVRIIISFYTTYLTGTFRSDNHFNKLSNIQMIILGCRLLMSPLVLLGFYWFLLYETIIIALNAILLHYARPFKLKPRFHLPELKSLFTIGFPIFVTSYLIGLVDTLPRLYIIKYGNANLLGLYSPVMMLLSTMALLPGTLSNYMYPKFSYEFGKTGKVDGIYRKILKLNAISLAFILLGCVIGYFALDYFVILFPKYTDALPYLALSLLTCPFILYKLGNILSVILKRLDYMFAYIIAYAFFQLTSLLALSLMFTDILKIVILSQIITAVFMLITSLLMNFLLVKNFNKKEALSW